MGTDLGTKTGPRAVDCAIKHPELSGHTVSVTGGTRGIGLGIVSQQT